MEMGGWVVVVAAAWRGLSEQGCCTVQLLCLSVKDKRNVSSPTLWVRTLFGQNVERRHLTFSEMHHFVFVLFRSHTHSPPPFSSLGNTNLHKS